MPMHSVHMPAEHFLIEDKDTDLPFLPLYLMADVWMVGLSYGAQLVFVDRSGFAILACVWMDRLYVCSVAFLFVEFLLAPGVFECA